MPRALLVAAIVLSAGSAGALTLSFDDLTHGAIVTESQGVVIQTVNVGGGPDLGVAFDSNRTGTADRDLERGPAGWASGNLAPHTDLGRMLIIQENLPGCSDGICERPDDEGSRPAGHFDLDFSAVGPFTTLQFDLVDVESVTMEAGSVELFSGSTSLGSLQFTEFLDDAGVVFGDNSANRIEPIDVAMLGGSGAFDRVRISLGGSGAIDNVTATAAVPEPGAVWLFALGFAAVRRRAVLRRG